MNCRKLFLLGLLLAPSVCDAQNGIKSGTGKFVPLKSGVEISPKGGLTIPSKDMKSASFLDNGWTAGIDAGLPLWKVQGSSSSPFSFSIGLVANADYNIFSSAGLLEYVQQTYKLSDGSLNPYFDNTSTNARVLQFTAGPQVSFDYKKIHITPSLQMGYMSFQRNGSTIFDSVENAGKPATIIPLVISKENKTGGMLVRPKINFGFDVSKYIRVSVASSFIRGPEINNEFHLWQPDNQNAGKPISADELASGKPVMQRNITQFKSLNIEFGIKMGLGITPISKTADNLPANRPTLEQSMYGDNNPKDSKNSAAGKASNTNNNQGNSNGVAEKGTSPTGKEAARQTYQASAPEVIFPTNNVKTSLVNNDLHITFKGSNTKDVRYELSIWKEEKGTKETVLQQTYPSNWDGTISNFADLVDKRKNAQNKYHLQIKAVPGNNNDGGGNSSGSDNYNDAPKNGVPVFDNQGLSSTVFFNVIVGCLPQLAVDLDSTKCADSGKTKVWGHVVLNNVTGITVSSITITDFKEGGFSGPAVPVSNLVPGVNLPPVNNSQFSFDVDKDMCDSLLFIRVLITYTCALTGETVSVPCADTIRMPCCKCNYCADSMKITSEQSTMTYSGSYQAQINQSFSVTPINITNVTAEIVYMSDKPNDSACQVCDKRPESVYHFGGTNTVSWNGGAAINGSAGNSTQTFPSKIVHWPSNNNGNISFNLTVGLPEVAQLDCCEMKTRICIRYSFTDVNCKKCDILICYTLNYGANNTEGK